MTSGHFELLSRAQDFISDHFRNHINPVFVFHDLVHIQQVVAACEEMAEYYQLPEDDRFALGIAAWFHDSGYSKGTAKDHETESIRLATNFLQQNNVSPDIIQKTASCIEATRLPQSPTSLISNIICDADLFHLGTDEFFEKSKSLRQEINDTHDQKVSKKEWRKINIRFLEGHRYFTDYARKKLDGNKQDHLQTLINKEDNNQEKPKEEKKEKTDKKNATKEKKATDSAQDEKKKKDAADKNERGISTMFRIMSNSQNTLSGMADSKANIMISVNSLIISIVLTGLLPTVLGNIRIAIPVFLMILVCVSAIIFSILATRPKITSGRFTEDDIQLKKVNLLFFGNFYNMNLNEYEWGMKELLNSREYLYNSMIKDIYFLGKVLAKKYKYLRISYNIFMYGLILVMIAFAVAVIFFKDNQETLG